MTKCILRQKLLPMNERGEARDSMEDVITHLIALHREYGTRNNAIIVDKN